MITEKTRTNKKFKKVAIMQGLQTSYYTANDDYRVLMSSFHGVKNISINKRYLNDDKKTFVTSITARNRDGLRVKLTLFSDEQVNIKETSTN